MIRRLIVNRSDGVEVSHLDKASRAHALVVKYPRAVQTIGDVAPIV